MARGFAGGLALGLGTGWKMGMERDEAEERKKDRELTREGQRIQLDRARKEEDFLKQTQAVIEKYSMEDAPVEDASGNVTTGRQPKKALSLADEIEMHRELGRLSFGAGKMTQADFMSLPKKIETFRKEGVFDALNEMSRTNDTDAGVAAFNKLGMGRIKSYMTRDVKDPLTGLPTKEFTVRTEDDRTSTFNLADMARNVGGIDKYIEWAKLGETARGRAAQERRNELTETRDEQRFQLGLVNAENQARRTDAILARGAGGANSARPSVFQQRLEAYRDAISSQFPELSEAEIHRRALSATDKVRGDVDINRAMGIAKDLLKDGRAKTFDDALDSAIRSARRAAGAGQPTPFNPNAPRTGERPSLDRFMR